MSCGAGSTSTFGCKSLIRCPVTAADLKSDQLFLKRDQLAPIRDRDFAIYPRFVTSPRERCPIASPRPSSVSGNIENTLPSCSAVPPRQ